MRNVQYLTIYQTGDKITFTADDQTFGSNFPCSKLKVKTVQSEQKIGHFTSGIRHGQH